MLRGHATAERFGEHRITVRGVRGVHCSRRGGRTHSIPRTVGVRPNTRSGLSVPCQPPVSRAPVGPLRASPISRTRTSTMAASCCAYGPEGPTRSLETRRRAGFGRRPFRRRADANQPIGPCIGVTDAQLPGRETVEVGRLPGSAAVGSQTPDLHGSIRVSLQLELPMAGSIRQSRSALAVARGDLGLA